eukprot:11243447-Alexandrium_andersonii.AAC.1
MGLGVADRRCSRSGPRRRPERSVEWTMVTCRSAQALTHLPAQRCAPSGAPGVSDEPVALQAAKRL